MRNVQSSTSRRFHTAHTVRFSDEPAEECKDSWERLERLLIEFSRYTNLAMKKHSSIVKIDKELSRLGSQTIQVTAPGPLNS